MCEYLGYEVVALQRIRIMNLVLGDLPVGEWRDLTPAELKTLKEAVKDSDGQPKVFTKEDRKKAEEKVKPEIKRREERRLKREQKKHGRKKKTRPELTP
jgi:23S rRNA pseudouridine2604 synthase